jgi:hypothetical protein
VWGKWEKLSSTARRAILAGGSRSTGEFPLISFEVARHLQRLTLGL